MIDSQSAADFDDWWPRALSRPPLLTALPQPRCLIQGGATTRAGRDRARSARAQAEAAIFDELKTAIYGAGAGQHAEGEWTEKASEVFRKNPKCGPRSSS